VRPVGHGTAFHDRLPQPDIQVSLTPLTDT
jgi:hypothetical protein